MQILAIDPGYERMGIALLEKKEGGEILLYSNCFKTPASLLFPERLTLIGKEIERIITAHKPEALAIETLVFNTNQKTALQVAEARGVVIFSACKHGLAVHEYTPLQVKIAITGYGRAPKEQMMAMLPKLISVPKTGKKQDDEYDAIAVGLTHCAHIRN